MLTSHVRASRRAITIRMRQIWRERSAHTAGPYRSATNASLRLDGRDLLASCSSPPLSLHFSRSESHARGRSDLHSPNDARTSQTHDSPGIRQDRRGMNAASSPFRQNGDSRLAATGRSEFCQQIHDNGRPGASLYIDTRDPRDDAVFRGPHVTGRPRYSARRAKVGFGGEFGGSRAARAGGTGVWAWNRRAEQLARMEHDLAAHTTALGNGGCCEVGEPAGALFDATARNDQHE